MNSQFQKSSTGSRGSRFSADDPPYARDERPDPQSAGASGKSEKRVVSPSGGTRAGNQPGGPSFGSSDSRSGSGQSFGTSGMSDTADDTLGSGNRSSLAGAASSRPTGTDALIEVTQDALGRAAETVHAASGAARETTAQIADVAKEALAATVSAVTAQAATLTANITDELRETAEAQKERGADAMQRFAKAIRSAAHELDDGSPEIARQIRAAAGSVDSLSSNLHGKSIGDLFTAASDFARNQPAAFFAGAVIAGFAFSRFLKSSSLPTARPNGEGEATRPASMPPVGTGNLTPSAPSAATF